MLRPGAGLRRLGGRGLHGALRGVAALPGGRFEGFRGLGSGFLGFRVQGLGVSGFKGVEGSGFRGLGVRV